MAESAELERDQRLATEEQTEKAMENVYEKLNTKFGAILMDSAIS